MDTLLEAMNVEDFERGIVFPKSRMFTVNFKDFSQRGSFAPPRPLPTHIYGVLHCLIYPTCIYARDTNSEFTNSGQKYPVKITLEYAYYNIPFHAKLIRQRALSPTRYIFCKKLTKFDPNLQQSPQMTSSRIWISRDLSDLTRLSPAIEQCIRGWYKNIRCGIHS
jgi:hypothetical protein